MIGLTHYRTAYTTDLTLIDDVQYPQRVHMFPELYRNLKLGLNYVPHKLAEKVLDMDLIGRLRCNSHGKTAFILAGGNAHFAGINPLDRKSQLTYQYKILPLSLTQVYAGRIAQLCGATDHIVTDSTACASSLKVMMDVQTLIRYYGFQRVIVLAVEDAVTNLTLEFFGEAKASLQAKDDDAGVLPSAFDSKNRGFHIGQGAVFAVFEKDPEEYEASLDGAYTSSEVCTNQLGQREDGQGFMAAMCLAMDEANMTQFNIDIIKTHGTGTESNNKSERSAIEKIFNTNHVVATSFKPEIGHTMGASGLLETCLLVDSLKTGIVPAIKNRTEEDRVYLSEPAKAPERATVLSLAAGMGNVYSAAIFTMGS
jgi:3-oxoacyl-(acyl-carrier-protein) synthase